MVLKILNILRGEGLVRMGGVTGGWINQPVTDISWKVRCTKILWIGIIFTVFQEYLAQLSILVASPLHM